MKANAYLIPTETGGYYRVHRGDSILYFDANCRALNATIIRCDNEQHYRELCANESGYAAEYYEEV